MVLVVSRRAEARACRAEAPAEEEETFGEEAPVDDYYYDDHDDYDDAADDDSTDAIASLSHSGTRVGPSVEASTHAWFV